MARIFSTKIQLILFTLLYGFVWLVLLTFSFNAYLTGMSSSTVWIAVWLSIIMVWPFLIFLLAAAFLVLATFSTAAVLITIFQGLDGIDDVANYLSIAKFASLFFLVDVFIFFYIINAI